MTQCLLARPHFHQIPKTPKSTPQGPDQEFNMSWWEWETLDIQIKPRNKTSNLKRDEYLHITSLSKVKTLFQEHVQNDPDILPSACIIFPHYWWNLTFLDCKWEHLSSLCPNYTYQLKKMSISMIFLTTH